MLIRERGKGRDGGNNGTNKRDEREMTVRARRQKDESSEGPVVFLRQSLGIDRCKSQAELKKHTKIIQRTTLNDFPRSHSAVNNQTFIQL